MKRDIIIIEDKTVSVTGNEVWMTAGEIAEEFHATVPAVNAAIKAVRKSDVLNDYEVCRYIQLENGLYADVYSLEIIIPVAFRLNTYYTHVFRMWLVEKALSKEKEAGIRDVHTEGKTGIAEHAYRQRKRKRTTPSGAVRFLFFHATALFQRLEVIRLQQFTQSRFGIKHLTCQKDKGQHPVVAILLQGAAAYPEHFRHLLVRQVMFPVQWRTVTFQKCGEPFGAFEHILYRGGNLLVLH